MGGILKTELMKLMDRYPFIGDVRGKGLMIGMELFPEAAGARRFCQKLMEKRILCKETHDNIIRFAPPLIIAKDEIDWALDRIGSVLIE